MFLTTFVSKCPSSTTSPSLPFCKTLPLKCLAAFWIRLCLDNWSVICTVILCYVLHQTHSEFSYIQHSVFSGICRHIQSYSALLRYIHAYWDITQAYSGIFQQLSVNLAFSQPYHILSPGTFRTGSLFRTLWNGHQPYSEPCHSALFSHIQLYSEPCTTLAYAETWHIRNPQIFRTLS